MRISVRRRDGSRRGRSDTFAEESEATRPAGFRKREGRTATAVFLAYLMAVSPITAQNGAVVRTPNLPMELPVEVEIELAPAASLKQAPLWKELIQLLKFPNAQNCTPNPTRPGMCITTAPVRMFTGGRSSDRVWMTQSRSSRSSCGVSASKSMCASQ